jgi:glycine/D-amino acid oxidase-like deaminating enzyme
MSGVLEIAGAIYGTGDGYLDGNELCSLLAEQARAAGVRVMVRTPLVEMPTGGSAKYTLATGRGDLPADVIVNAGGAWAAQIGDRLGAPVTVINERHECHIFELPSGVSAEFPALVDYMPDDALAQSIGLRPEGDNQLVVGIPSPTAEKVADPDDCYKGVTEEWTDRMLTIIARALPELGDIRYRDGCAGIYPVSPGERDRGPRRLYAGPHPANEDILVGGGLGGAGLTVGPALGQVLAHHVRFGEARGTLGESLEVTAAVAGVA